MDSNFVPFYLKYRPQALLDVIGQEAVKKTIHQAFRSNRLSHAYLFVGPRGTGKTSLARILAKMVNCEVADSNVIARSETTKQSKKEIATLPSVARNDEVDVPCNKCSTCLSITDGSNLDLIEIDAASNRGIEDIRSLREKIKLTPTAAKKKVYIIDEAHMLTTEAFNALLKTLEEPPNHVLFILATTDVQKVPQTILSRTQRLDFSLATPKDLKQALEKIIKAEKITIEEEALSLLIKKADGSFRDGVKMLDQLATKDGKIETSDVLKNFRSLSFESLEALLQNLSYRETSQSLMEVQKLVENGVDVKETILSLMDLIRSIMLIKNGLGENLVKPYVSLDKYESMVGLANKFENKNIIKNLDILQKAYEKLKFASIPSLPLELAILEICGEAIQPPVIATPSEATPEAGEARGKQSVKKEEIASSPSAPRNDEKEKPLVPSNEIIPAGDIAKLKEKWTFVLETIKPYNFSLEALLRSVRISECSDTIVVMEVPYSFHQRILEAPKNRDILEGILSDVLGRQIRVSIVLGSRPQHMQDLANVEVAQDDEIIKIASEIFNSDSVN